MWDELRDIVPVDIYHCFGARRQSAVRRRSSEQNVLRVSQLGAYHIRPIAFLLTSPRRRLASRAQNKHSSVENPAAWRGDLMWAALFDTSFEILASSERSSQGPSLLGEKNARSLW